MSDSITYSPDSPKAQVKVGKKRIMAGDTVHRGDIPDDAYDYLAKRPDFGGDLEAWANRRAQKSEEPAIGLDTVEE